MTTNKKIKNRNYWKKIRYQFKNAVNYESEEDIEAEIENIEVKLIIKKRKNEDEK